jgi:hypothetical protein
MTTIPARRFVAAFSAAAHDVKLEDAGYQLYHFFDSDFLGRLIFGFRDSINQALIRGSRSDGEQGQMLLMGALVGQDIGAPPLMRALLPHLYEVRRSVEGPRRHGTRYDVEQAMEELGLEQSLNSLRRALAAGASPDELLELLVAQGPQIFYGTELVSGVWEERLGRVLKLGIEHPGPFEDDPNVVDTEEFVVLADHVHVKEARGSGGVNGLRDAMALATLAQAVQEVGVKRQARFYTETPRILNAWEQSEQMRALLSYNGHAASDDYGQYGVLRTVEYYLIRALIPELGYSRSGVGVGEMYTIADELAEAAKELHNYGISKDRLSDVKIGDETLDDYMAQLTDLSSYGSAWRSLKHKLPERMPHRLMRQLNEVLEGEERRADALEESFRRQVKDLSKRTKDVGDFTDDYGHLLDRLRNWHGALRPRVGGNLSEHVGLTRWGLEPTDDDEDALKHLVESYEDWRGDSQEARAGERATKHTGLGLIIEITQRLRDMRTTPGRGPDHLAECVALLGFLWLLGDYPSVVKYGRQFQEGILKAPLALAVEGRGNHARDERYPRYGAVVENLCAAAALQQAIARLRRVPEGAVAEKLLAETHDIVESLSESKRKFRASAASRAVTQGFVMFTVWRALNPGVMSGRSPTEAPALVRKSFEICYAVLETCPPASPMYALLLNHCVYVAAVSGLIDDRVVELADELRSVRLSQPTAWSYRLDDTIAFYYFVRARDTWAKFTRSGQTDPRLVEDAIADVAQAERFLRFVPEVNDSEVLDHRTLLLELKRKLPARAADSSYDEPMEDGDEFDPAAPSAQMS